MLIVDDEVGIRNVLTELLRERGFDSSAVATGTEGLKAVVAGFHNIVILDIGLPDIDGTKLLERINAISPDTEVILVTGHATLSTAIEGLRKHIYDYIPKPFKLGQLLESIDGALEHQRLKVENRRMLDQLKYLNNITSQVSRTMDVDLILKQLLFVTMNYFHADSGAIYLRNREEWALKQHSGVTKKFLSDFSVLGADHPIAKEAARSSVSFAADESNGHSAPSWASVPLVYNDRPVGIMVIVVEGGRRFDDEDKRLLSIVGAQAGSSIYNSVAFLRGEEKRTYLEGLIENAPDAVVTYALDGMVRSWNPAAASLYGYGEKEAIGRYLLIVPDDQLEEMRAIMVRVANGEQVSNLETMRTRRDGTLVDVEVGYSPVRDPGGKIVGIASMSRDISDRKRKESDLREKAVNSAQNDAKELIMRLVPLALGRDVSGEERDSQIPMLTSKLGDALFDRYFSTGEAVTSEKMGQAVAGFFNELGGQFEFQVNGNGVVVIGRRCPWHNEELRNPGTCAFTKALSAAFAQRAWGSAKVTISQSLANRDDCCRVVIHRSRSD